MKRASVVVFACWGLLSLGQEAFAAKRPLREENGFLVDANVVFHRLGKDVRAQAKVILSSDSNKWTTLIENKEGIAVYARKVEADSESVSVEYMAMDLSQAPAKEVSTLGMKSLIGEKSQISSHAEDGSENFTVESKVVKVRYQAN